MKSIAVLAAIGSLIGCLLTHHSANAESNRREARNQLTAEQLVARADANIARIKADLRLTAAQEKDWTAAESALRDIAKKRADQLLARRAARAERKGPLALPDRLRRRAEVLSNRSSEFKTVGDAIEPLYGSLDERQKDRLGNRVSSFLKGDID